MRPYNFAIIGKGFIHQRHENAIKNIGGKIIMDCDINGPADYADWVEMFQDPKFTEVDYVSILTPNDTHSTIVREALRLKKKVICEKPLSIHDDIREDNPDLYVVLQLRHNKLVQELKKATDVDNIHIHVRTHREQQYWASWKGKPTRSGGLLFNMGIHYFDLMIHLLGDPKKVSRFVYDGKKRATGTVTFKDGLGSFDIEIVDEPIEVERCIMVNGRLLDLEGATIPLNDNGEVVDLHTEVYKEILKRKRIPLEEIRKSIKLVQNLYAKSMS